MNAEQRRVALAAEAAAIVAAAIVDAAKRGADLTDEHWVSSLVFTVLTEGDE